jgi:hypothetical protein
MKAYFVILAVAVTIVLVLTNTPTASARFQLEDPQLCVNGQLLSVAFAHDGEAYVSVPQDAEVDFNLADCGGNDEVIPADNVMYNGKNKMTVVAVTADDNFVAFSYNGKVFVKRAVDGVAQAKFNLP